MVLDDEVGCVAVAGPLAAGSDPRSGDSFSLAQAEVDKLNNINALTPVDWVKVSASCTHILREEGKDLTVGVWLLCAWSSLHGITGLASGVKVLHDLLLNYWAELTPPQARIRARRGQIEWMFDWLDGALSKPCEPVAQSCVNDLVANWDAIEKIWHEHDPEGPGFFRLRRCLEALAVEEAPPVAPAALVEHSMASVAVEPPASTPAEPVTPPVPRVKLAVDALAYVEELDAKGFDRVVREGFAAFKPLIAQGLQADCPSPLLFRVSRQIAWMALDAVPSSQQGVTRVPAPMDSELMVFAAIRKGGGATEIVRFCESRLPAYPFWLELNRVCHAALLELGPQGVAAAASVALEVRHLMARLPGLAELKFASELPFADGATLSWLEAIMPVPAQGEALDAIAVLIDQAGAEAAAGKLHAALQTLQVHLGTLSGGRDRFRVRRAQCELLHRFDPRPHLRLVLDVIIQEALEQGLDRWEPELLRPLLELTLQYRNGGVRVMGSEQLVLMDLPAFWRLASAGLALAPSG